MRFIDVLNKYMTPLCTLVSIWMFINFSFLDYDLGNMLLWLFTLVLNSIFFIRQIKSLD